MPNTTELAVRKTTELTATPLRLSIDDPDADARAIWAQVFPFEPWPDEASVRWAYRGVRGFRRGCYADFIYLKPLKIRIYVPIVSLPAYFLKDDSQKYLGALIHELVHLHGHLNHGRSFYKTQNRVRAILGLEPVWHTRRWCLMPKVKKLRRTAPLPLREEARP